MFGSRAMAMCCRNRRQTLKSSQTTRTSWKLYYGLAACFVVSSFFLTAPPAFGQATSGPVRITLDDAIDMAIKHNHFLIALRTTIQQSEAEEITQGLRPNPTLFGDWEYLPLGSPAQQNPDVYN